MLEKIRNKIFLSIGFAGLVYIGFVFYADYDLLINVFAKFNWMLLPLLLLLSFLNYVSRFFKWDFYLKLLNVKIKSIDSFSIFMSGLIMSITPGKFGELLKVYLVKQINGTSVSRTAPIIFAERITDFISLLIIALIGAYLYNFGGWIVILVSAFFALVVLIISWRKAALSILSLFEKNKFLKKYFLSIHSAYESSYEMLKPNPLLFMTLLSLVSWAFECLGYYLILANFQMDFSFFWASFNYAFSTIVGAITMLPGGLGVTEGSLTLILVQNGAEPESAVASTFLIRAVTLWFAVLVGVISVFLYQKRFGKIVIENEN